MDHRETKYESTAKKMNRALITLLEQKDFDYITIKELCQVAGVNRSTFYLHYENMVELLSETLRNQLDEFMSYFPISPHLSDGFATCPPEELLFISEEYLHPYFTYIRDHKAIFRTTVDHPQIFNNEQIYHRMFTHIFDPILSRFHYTEQQRNYVMRFYLSGITAIVMEWLKKDCQESVKTIGEIVMISIFGRK